MIAIVAGVIGFVAAAFGAVLSGTPGMLLLWVPSLALIGLGFASEVRWAERQAQREAME